MNRVQRNILQYIRNCDPSIETTAASHLQAIGRESGCVGRDLAEVIYELMEQCYICEIMDYDECIYFGQKSDIPAGFICKTTESGGMYYAPPEVEVLGSSRARSPISFLPRRKGND